MVKADRLPIPLILIVISHLHQGVEHFSYRRKDAGIGGIGILQVEQMRQELEQLRQENARLKQQQGANK